MLRNILITGAGRGIGRALAIEFAMHDWQVFASARNPEALETICRESPNIHPLELDVLDDFSVTRSKRSLQTITRSLDVLVNNAAIFPGEGNERLEEIDLAWFSRAFETNVVGAARVTREFLPLLRRASGARIVNISSGAGSISEKEDYDYYPYSVSKAALNMLTRAQAAELRSENIVVVAMSPGWVKTEMGGPNAPLEPEESAASIRRTIEGLDASDSGKFLGRDGSSKDYPW